MDSKNKIIRFDWAIKHILRDKSNYDILEGFLSAILDEDITVQNIIESESNQSAENIKFNRVDILVKDKEERQFIIEVQNNHESHFLERILFGASKAIGENLDLNSSYSKVTKIISISILYFPFGKGDDYIYYGSTEFYGMNTKTQLLLKEKKEKDGISVMVEKENVFPEYYLIRVEKFEDIIKSPIDEWIYMLKNNEVKEEFKSKNMESVRKKLKVMNMSKEKKKEYERYLENLLIEKDVIQTAIEDGVKIGREEGVKIGREEGVKTGIEKGEKIGIEKGEKIGIEKGEKIGIEKGEKIGIEKGEYKKSVAIAIALLKKGIQNKDVSELTGLSEEEVEKLRKKLDADG